MRDAKARERWSVGFDGSGNPVLTMQDAEGAERWWVGFDARSAPLLQMSDARTRARAAFTTDELGRAVLNVFDDAGLVRHTLPAW